MQTILSANDNKLQFITFFLLYRSVYNQDENANSMQSDLDLHCLQTRSQVIKIWKFVVKG